MNFTKFFSNWLTAWFVLYKLRIVSPNPFIWLLLALLFVIGITIKTINSMNYLHTKAWLFIVLSHLVPLFFINVDYDISNFLIGLCILLAYNIWLLAYFNKDMITLYYNVYKDLKNNTTDTLVIMKILIKNKIIQ